MPKVSVIIPAFNAEDFIKTSIESVQKQTYLDWEILVVDDGSTDQTTRIVQRLASEDVRIKLICQDNSGPSVARNRGVDKSSGEILCFLDADDIWFPQKLQKVVDYFEQNHGDALFNRCNIKGKTDILSEAYDRSIIIKDLLGVNPICTLSNLSVRKCVFKEIGGFKENMRYAEDLEWLVRLVSRGFHLMGTSDVLVSYNTTDDGLSSDLEAMHGGFIQTINAFPLTITASQRSFAEAQHLRYLARRALRLKQQRLSAFSFCIRAIKTNFWGFFHNKNQAFYTLIFSAFYFLLPQHYFESHI